MSDSFDRRSVLKGVAASAVALGALAEGEAFAAGNLHYDDAVPFSWDLFKARARERAHGPYAPPPRPAPEIVQKINYEEWGKIHFNTDNALFADGPGKFPLSFFHLGLFFQKAIEIHVVDGGMSKRLVYDQSYFDMPADSVAQKLPKGAGFAGFKIQEARDGALDWRKNDWVAFLGAAYFRAIGELRQYGLSARGVALDVAVSDRPEEFPDFTNFYVDQQESADSVTLYALMEGPSIVGAYKFVMKRDKAVIMDIETTLFMRAQVSRFGIGALTSMYWFSETKKETAIDWRPEVHDSDGLCMWTGSGERLWRPLNNPPRIMISAFSDNNPRGFGLCQRDRVFDHYQDGVNYNRRPTLWIEPLPTGGSEGWGKGSIQLCEIPTDDEIHDNVVCMWVPADPIPAGAEIELAYRLHWVADEPFQPKLGRVVATRLGRGGQPGLPRPKGVRKFVIEFLGGPLATLPYGVTPELVVNASRGSLQGYRHIEAVADDVPGHWRVEFDLSVEGADPVELRAYLTAAGETITENWMFQYHPF